MYACMYVYCRYNVYIFFWSLLYIDTRTYKIHSNSRCRIHLTDIILYDFTIHMPKIYSV